MTIPFIKVYFVKYINFDEEKLYKIFTSTKYIILKFWDNVQLMYFKRKS